MSDEVFEQPTVVIDPPVTTDSMMSAPPPPLPVGVEVTVDPQSTLPEGVTVSVLPNGDQQYSGCVIVVECDDPRFDVVAEVGTADTLPATGGSYTPGLPQTGAMFLAVGMLVMVAGRRSRRAVA